MSGRLIDSRNVATVALVYNKLTVHITHCIHINADATRSNIYHNIYAGPLGYNMGVYTDAAHVLD